MDARLAGLSSKNSDGFGGHSRAVQYVCEGRFQESLSSSFVVFSVTLRGW
jgi:hypothetical protein